MSNLPDNSTARHRDSPVVSMPQLLLRISSVCEALDCGESFVRGLIDQGEVEVVKRGPKFVRIVATSLVALVERSKINTKET